LRGESSFGGLMQRRGFASVPSPAQPHAGETKFFGGGYNTRRYASPGGGTIFGLQIESPRPGLRDTAPNRSAFAAVFVEVVIDYLEIHADIDLGRKSGRR
jgi:hypothetical protein